MSLPAVVEGVVEKGDQRGRELGFPTANLSIGPDAPRRDGVWAGLVRLADGADDDTWVAAVSVGRRPTFYGKHGVRLLEAHLLGFDGDLYGQQVEVELARWIRPMRRFDSTSSLDQQIARDVADVRAWSVERGFSRYLDRASTSVISHSLPPHKTKECS